MKNKKIIIAGGTGFIGQEICNYFGNENKIVILTRQLPDQKTNAFGENSVKDEVLENITYLKWDGSTLSDWAVALEGAQIINMVMLQ